MNYFLGGHSVLLGWVSKETVYIETGFKGDRITLGTNIRGDMGKGCLLEWDPVS